MTVPEAPKKHTNSTDTPHLPITLFVYGSLKRGFSNHDHYCRNAIDIRPATTWGRMYLLPAGYPALEVPESHILAHGTADTIADAQTQVRLNTNIQPFTRPAGDWDLIQGELLTFSNTSNLLDIDHLEGFHPTGRSSYLRALSFAFIDSVYCAAWVYHMTCVPGCCPRLITF